MQSDHFSLLVLSKFPYPVARGFRAARDQRDSREAACTLFQLLAEYLGQVLVAEYLSRDDRDPEMVQEFSKLLQRAPSTGTWIDWIHRIAKTHDGESDTVFFRGGESLADKSFRSEMEYLLERRNRWAHSSVQFSVEEFRGRLFHVMERLRTVHQAPLFALQSASVSGQLNVYKAKLLQGDNPHLAEIECRSSSSLDTGRVFMYGQASGEVLSLHPFILYAQCEQCGDHHYFQYSRPRKRKIVFSSVPDGHEHVSTEAFALFERYFRHARPARERPRHFTVPGEFAGVPRTLRAGDSVGAYRIEELIKIGGMAQVYRATDTRTEKEFALKLLPLEFTRDSVLLMRFEEEAHNLKLLEHPNVVALHDFGEDFGDHYLVLDLAHGGPIGNQRCRDLSELRKPLAEADILHIGKQVCEALTYVHSRGITHRDLKPGNVVVSGDKCQITDFGIARSRGDASMTLTGLPVGTPEYMSPEQVQQGEVDHRSDIYSMGCILYELAAGRPPYRAETPLTTALYHVQASPPRLEDLNPRISKGLRNIMYKALQKSPEHRYQSARALYDDLQAARKDPAGPQVIEGNKTPQDALEEVKARERLKFRRRFAATLGGFLVVMVMAFMGQQVYRLWRAQHLADLARQAWEQGPTGWEEACELIKMSRQVNQEHSAVRALRADMFNNGGLVVNVVGGGNVKLKVSAKPKEDEKLGLKFTPQVLADKDEFRSGERIPLTLGHYEVTVTDDAAEDPITFPVCITQVRYEEDLEGKWEPLRLLPDEVAEPGDSLKTVVIAENFTIDNLVLPEMVPAGFAFVNPGPFFRSEPDWEESTSVEDHAAFRKFNIVADTLNEGFLMARYETTVDDFERWFVKHGKQYCQWKWQQERVLGNWTNLRKVKACVRYVPLDVQREYWAEQLGRDGVDADTLSTSDALMESVFAEEITDLRGDSEGYRTGMLQTLSTQTSKDHPVVNVDLELARHYAWTHAPVLAAEFKPWLKQQIQARGEALSLLEELSSKLSAVEEEYFPEDSLPLQPRLRSFEPFQRHSIAASYINFFWYHCFYCWQAPVDDIISWARKNMGKDPELEKLRGRLDEIEARLSNPHQWAFESFDGKFLIRDLIAAFGDSVDNINRDNFLRWLNGKQHEERDEKMMLEKLLAEAETMDEDQEASDVPWIVRIEYGAYQGWDISTTRQWEKAARGADTRRYPWGPQPNAVTVYHDKPVAVDVMGDFDLSPYYISGLGGNVCEWVRSSGQGRKYALLKGGGFRFDATYCNIGYLLATRETPDWGGIRLIRKIRAPKNE